jgi:hypothetical protein
MEEGVEVPQRRKPLHDVNDLREEAVNLNLLFRIQIEFKLNYGEPPCVVEKAAPHRNQTTEST